MKIEGSKNLAFRIKNKVSKTLNTNYNVTNNAVLNTKIAFKGNSIIAKRFWMKFRNLSDYMKEASEMTNSIIAMIGTGIIAPFAIMCSPGKKCKHANKTNLTSEQEQKKCREKKFFQAIRQPVSAVLAFAFQVPTTVGIAKGFNKLAYEKHIKLFDDETLGHLIPDKKYLKSQAEKVLIGKANPKLTEAWKEELELFKDKDALKQEFMDKIRQDYKEVGIEIDNSTLKQMANSKKKMTRFIAEKMTTAKHDRLLTEKVQELSTKHFDIKDVELVTEDYKNLAKLRYGEEIKTLKENAKLSWFDKFLQSMGFSNKKVTQLNKAEETLVKEKGLELMKKDMPKVFTDNAEKLKKFVENTNIKAQKLYANKIFWLTLVTNVIMVGISCVALNWFHPKLASVIDKIRGKKPDENQPQQKVEVKA